MVPLSQSQVLILDCLDVDRLGCLFWRDLKLRETVKHFYFHYFRHPAERTWASLCCLILRSIGGAEATGWDVREDLPRLGEPKLPRLLRLARLI
mmetsp:Transcript_22427/g.26273  ORF Transcript_22427/g.26273 Transcript_22427/m.26273 type:complete len:94 (-) Transcript_22427:305-586(-)